MPFYVHLSSVSADAIAEALDTIQEVIWPDDRDRPCGCVDCVDAAWSEYWNTNPDVARVRPSTVPALVLTSFASAREAHEAMKTLRAADPLTVTFIPTEQEKLDWRRREDYKLRESGCQRLPWYGAYWQRELNKLHRAYLSVEKPGLIAYTPSEEYGVADRQLRVRPGRYLEQFAPHLTKTEIDELCAQVKAIDDSNVVRFASSPDDVVRVYRNGPQSCMSKDVSEYASHGIHPVTVYGNSDLQVAYLEDDSHIRARVVVWPEKKIYSRVYGDNTISYLLAKDGYQSGSLHGARVRAIRLTPDVYVMPYVDGIEGADHIGQYFRLNENDRDDYGAQNTNGTTDSDYQSEPDYDDEPTSYACAHCGEVDVDDEGDLCSSCMDSRYICSHCDDAFFADYPHNIDDYGVVCHSCYLNHAHACADCEKEFIEQQYSRTVIRERSDHGLTAYCADCGDTRHEKRLEDEARLQALQEQMTALRVAMMTNRFMARVIATGLEMR